MKPKITITDRAKKIMFWFGVVSLITGSGFYAYIITKGKDLIALPGQYDELKKDLSELHLEFHAFRDSVQNEMAMGSRVIESIHYDVIDLEAFRSMIRLFARNVSELDEQEYYTAFDDGNKIKVEIRKTKYGEDWAFLYNEETLYPAIPSRTENKPVIIPNDGRPSAVIRKEN